MCFRSLLVFASLLGTQATAQFEHEHFRYDTPDETVKSHVLDNPNCYDADIALVGDDLAMAWLEFVPGKGDRLCSGRWHNGLHEQETVSELPAGAAHPSIVYTNSVLGEVFTTFEQKCDSGYWNVAAFLPSSPVAEKQARSSRVVSLDSALAINHRVASRCDDEAWIVWQQANRGQFDIVAERLRKGGESVRIAVAVSPQSEWEPDVAVASDNSVCVVYDTHDGESYNVHAWVRKPGANERTFQLSSKSAFEGRARVAADSKGRFWIVWEEGAANWGKRYVTRMRLKSHNSFEMTDDNGPLHRFRRLRMAVIEPDGTVKRLKDPLPMPSFKEASRRSNSPEGSRQLGVFYERAAIAVDAGDKVWIVYRHYYVPYLGCEWITHNQSPWGVYARCLTSMGWSKLYRFDVGQGDGMQRLEITPHGRHGIAAAWTTGRTHRSDRESVNLPRGVVVATVKLEADPPGSDLLDETKEQKRPSGTSTPPTPTRQKSVVGDKEYELVFGDLHRHTDLSLCFVPADGTMNDHYRYAIDVVQHDFMGITDHARDIVDGDALSQLWWRCSKEVSRHDLGSRFIPFSAYERSRGGEDHNVISLGIAPLRPYTYPHPEFWKELDDRTITIPHQTNAPEITDFENPPRSISDGTWDQLDDVHRPLIEVYQSCRDRWIGMDAHEGLRKGNHMGFIASSDHLATSSSYACVWTPERSREAIFQAMKDRRTFAATDTIRLILRAGDHWMGERIEASAMPRIDLEVEGTAPLKSIEVIVDGKKEQTLPQTRQKVTLTYQPAITEPGEHWVYARVMQEDGNRAWSSPLFVDIRK